MQKELGWGRKAVERFKVDKEQQVEALRQIGIDVNLYLELERRAALEAEIRRATIQQEQSAEGKYFRYIKPGKQVTPKEKELKTKIAALLPMVREQRKHLMDLEQMIAKCNDEISANWRNTNKEVQNCFNEDERLEKNGTRLVGNCNRVVGVEKIDLETVKARIAKDLALLKSECDNLDRKIADQKTHVEYIRNYERLGLPRDLRKIDQLENELRRLKSKEMGTLDSVSKAPEVEALKAELSEHISQICDYYAKCALKNRVPTGLLEVVRMNQALITEKERLENEIAHLHEESIALNTEIDKKIPIRQQSAIVKRTLYPKFSTSKLFGPNDTPRSTSAMLPPLNCNS